MRNALLILLFSCYAYSQDITTLNEDRKNTLLYGIDSEVISLLDDLQDENNKDLFSEITDQFEHTSNIKLKKRIIEYFIALESNEIEDQVLDILYNDPVNEELILASLSYVQDFKIMDSESVLDSLVNDTRSAVAISAVKTIGELGLKERIPLLKELFEDDNTSDGLQSEILLALGKLKDESSLDLLIDLLEDPDEDRSNRWYACAALGEIQGERAFSAVKNALDDNDTILRTYAIAAAAKFTYPEVENILIHEGLRDSFWKVRLTAIEQIEKHMYRNAGGALRYKAAKDPENKIRERAVVALGTIGGAENFDFLKEMMLDEKESHSLRTAAAVGSGDHRPAHGRRALARDDDRGRTGGGKHARAGGLQNHLPATNRHGDDR